MKKFGIILTGENKNTRKRTCPSANISSINSTLTELGLNTGLCCKIPVANLLRNYTAFCAAITYQS
jgi:hypothetical protein